MGEILGQVLSLQPLETAEEARGNFQSRVCGKKVHKPSAK